MSFAYVRDSTTQVEALESIARPSVPGGFTEVETALDFNPIKEHWTWAVGPGFVFVGTIAVPSSVIKMVLIVKDSSKGGTTYLSHNIFQMGASGTSTIEWQIHVPHEWDSDQDPTIHFVGLFNLAGSSESIVYEYTLEKTGNGEIIDGVDDVVMNFTEGVPDTVNELYYSALKTIDASALGLAINDHLRLTFRRLGSNGNDDRPGDLKFLHLMVNWPKA